MKGVLLCKFDEERGYIPVKVYPPKLRKRRNSDLFKEIARNAIGFGTQVDYQAFSLSDIHCLAKRFSITVTEARGGATLYALVIFSGDSEEFDKKMIGETTDKLLSNWESRANIIESLYYRFSPEDGDGTPAPSTISIDIGGVSRPIFPEELFVEKEGFFADGTTVARNLLMLLSIVAMFWILYSNYNLFSFSFMLVIGIFVFCLVATKDKSLKVINGFLLCFIILLFIKLIFQVIGETTYIAFLGSFPDFTRPDLALLSFFCGLLICFGLDRGHAVDKGSFLIGVCGAIFLVLFFFTFVGTWFLGFFQ